MGEEEAIAGVFRVDESRALMRCKPVIHPRGSASSRISPKPGLENSVVFSHLLASFCRGCHGFNQC
ncbi:MAG: hypothetical protein ACPHJ3_12055, partial [Rubripirellula sp.]